MKFKNAIKTHDIIVENGPLGTRLKFEHGVQSIFEIIDQASGKKALNEIYEGDIAIAQEYQLPIIINAATYRANRNHLTFISTNFNEEIKRINTLCLKMINDIQRKHNRPGHPVYTGAPLGSMYDAYSIETIPSIEEAKLYHSEQINIFKNFNIDFINVVTIPTISEAIGIALAAEESGLDYTIGFILNDRGTLLDGTNLDNAIETIDRLTNKNPIGYLITCTHASIILPLIEKKEKYSRLLGTQPNGSNLSRDQLTKAEIAVADSPEKFASDVLHLKNALNLKIIGGCCGTTRAHLECLSKELRPKPRMHAHY